MPIPRITQDAHSWQAGYIAAMSDDAPVYPLEGCDRLTFWSGFAEGKAAIRRAAAARAEGEPAC
jgi:hypothetical protein